jgi:hypothetical protein
LVGLSDRQIGYGNQEFPHPADMVAQRKLVPESQ